MQRFISPVLGGIVGLLLLIFIFALIAAIPTWLLWNWLMPPIFSLPSISLLQALGINLFAGILFKGSGKIGGWAKME